MCVVASPPAVPASAETSEGGADNAATAATASSAPLASGCDAALWAIAGCSCGLAARLAVCQTSHALTASVDACRTLCELIALLACLFSTKYGEKGSSLKSRLHNSTYGLSRGVVVASLISRVLFASFSLALFVAALQAVAAHAGHEGAPHAPLILLLAGSVFALFALLRCMLRYTMSRRTSHSLHPLLASAPADLISSLIVASSALAAIFGGPDVARLADPILAATACILLVVFDYRELYSASLLLLQVSPHTNLPAQLKTSLNAIHGVQSFHELHAWQLTPSNHVVTAHIVYKSPSDYMKSKSLVMDVFIKYGFTHVTLQPEFKSLTDGSPNEEWCAWGSTCAVGDSCGERRCCILPRPDLSVVINKH